MEYLIKTYTNENEIVLDNTMGSGTTGVACIKTNRQFIGIEKEKQYYDVAVRRLSGCFMCNSFDIDNSHLNWKQCNKCGNLWVA